MRYAFIDSVRKAYPVTVLCDVMEVKPSGFYSYLKRQQRPVNVARVKQVMAIKEIHHDVDQSYGNRRMAKAMTRRGYPMGRCQARTLMNEAQVFARFPVKYKVTTHSAHNHPAHPNLLARDFTASAPNRMWVSDITFCWTGQGWLYLVIILDLYSRKVVGWAMDKRMKASLVVDALMMAIWQRQPDPGLIFHSDQGVQYASHAVRRILKQFGMRGSMSRKGDCWDNAVAERFFRSLKSERLLYRFFETRSRARQEIIRYIEMFYNSLRLHSYLGYDSPNDFEKQNQVKKVA